MTSIAFHFNAPAKLPYTCRLLRKAVAGGASVAVLGDAQTLGRLDELLWTFSPLDFLPHVLVQTAEEPQPSQTPIWLCTESMQGRKQQVLVNLTSHVPAGFDHYERIIEIVTPDEADRQTARQRWKQYSSGGFHIVRHDLQLAF
jgi:DNA polymerase-3 subunit chi